MNIPCHSHKFVRLPTKLDLVNIGQFFILNKVLKISKWKMQFDILCQMINRKMLFIESTIKRSQVNAASFECLLIPFRERKIKWWEKIHIACYDTNQIRLAVNANVQRYAQNKCLLGERRGLAKMKEAKKYKQHNQYESKLESENMQNVWNVLDSSQCSTIAQLFAKINGSGA